MENYYRELPQDFSQIYCIDAKNKKTSLWLTLFSFILTVAVAVPFFYGFSFSSVREEIFGSKKFIAVELGFLAGIFLYLVLHELVHGLVYKITTHEKLTFGLTLSVAYCGVPDLYVKRGPMIAAILAPFVSFSVLFGVMLIGLEQSVYWYFLALLFAIHVGGCIGDLYGAIYMIFKHRDKEMLINDTGPKQTFYIKG